MSVSTGTNELGYHMLKTLFFRNFDRFSGGHLKVWDYFNHVKCSPAHSPLIHFSQQTAWDASNPWNTEGQHIVPRWDTHSADIVFLAGTDWKVLTSAERRKPPCPIINLIQHVRHAEPADKRFRYLKHKAVRICASEEVASALRASGQPHGPVFTIPYGLDDRVLPPPLTWEARSIDILIAGLKNPSLAETLSSRLHGLDKQVVVLASQLQRRDFLDMIRRARFTIFLPNRTEGFYLPALEGMYLQTLVICPDCVGNRGFCHDGKNCLRPVYTEEALLGALDSALKLCETQIHELLACARATTANHWLEQERRSFLDVLNNLSQMW